MTQLVIDHLWQSTLFVALVALLTLAFRTNGAHIRFGLWFAASLKFLVPFPLIVEAGKRLQWASAPSIPADAPWADALSNFVAPTTTFAPNTAEPMPSFIVAPPEAAWNAGELVWAAWICGVGAVLLWQASQWLRLRTVLRASSPMPVAAPIRVLASPALFEPGLVGVFRPALVLPNGIAEHLSPQQLDLVLAHELCHWRRRDNLTAAVHMTIEALFWFHPLVWWIGRRLVAEREQACDESILAGGGSPQTYAESILAVCRHYMRSPLACASGVSGANLKVRIARVLRNHAVRRLGRVKAGMLAAFAAATLIVPLAAGVLTAEEAIAETESAAAAPTPDSEIPVAAEPQLPDSIPAPSPAAPVAPTLPAPVAPKPTPRAVGKLPERLLALPPGLNIVVPRRDPTPDSVPAPSLCLLGAERCSQETKPCLLDAASCEHNATFQRLGSAPNTTQVAALNSVQPSREMGNRPTTAQQPAAQTSPEIEAVLARAATQVAEKVYRKAIAAYGEAIRLAPTDAKLWLMRGNAHLVNKDYRGAIADFDEAIRLEPRNADAFLSRGNAYFARKNQLDRAVADYDKAIALRPDFAVAYNNRGFAYMYAKRPATSKARNRHIAFIIANYSMAIRLKPDFAYAYFNRASMYPTVESPDVDNPDLLARADYKEAIRLMSGQSQKSLLPNALTGGDYREAVRFLSGSAEQQSLLASAWNGLNPRIPVDRWFPQIPPQPYTPPTTPAAPLPPPPPPPAPAPAPAAP